MDNKTQKDKKKTSGNQKEVLDGFGEPLGKPCRLSCCYMKKTMIGVDPMLEDGSYNSLSGMRVTPLPASGRRDNERAIKGKMCSMNFMAAYGCNGETIGGQLQAVTFAEQAEVV